MSSGLLQVFVEHGDLHGTSNFIETTGVACSDSVSHNRVQVLSIPVLLLACSEDWTCNLQIIVSLEAQGTNVYNLLDNSEWILGYYKLNVLTLARITSIMYDSFTCAHIQIFLNLAFLIIGSHIVFNSILGLLSRSL